MDFELMLDSIPKILGGARLTVLLVTLSLSMGFVLAIIVALATLPGGSRSTVGPPDGA